MARTRTRALAPLWILLVAAVLLAWAVAMRIQLVAPIEHHTLVSAPAAVQADTAPARSESRPAKEKEAPAPSSPEHAVQPAPETVPSQAQAEAKGAQRQPPASQTCGSNLLQVCGDQ